jgi:hypothetical protein
MTPCVCYVHKVEHATEFLVVIQQINSVKQRHSSEANSHSASQKNSLPFVEPKSSLSFSQEPASGLQPEPDTSNLHLPTLFP